MFETIVRINREGTTVLLVEQNAKKALSIAHSAYVLETGAVVLSGTAAEIRDNPKVIGAYLGG
jgi:branched-chain amino acid transport system ATP-binding protein